MKIAYIATAEVPSQKANSLQVMKVCQALVQIGETVHLFVPGRIRTDWDVLAANYGVTERFQINWIPSRAGFKRLDFTLGSLQKARTENTDIVYTRMLWVARLSQVFSLPVILEIHDLPTGHYGPMLYKHFLKSGKAKLVVYITDALKRLADDHAGVTAREDEFIIAPDGVDLERYSQLPDPPKARNLLGLPEKITAAYSGSFYEGRGLETLLELAVSFPDTQFLWIGGSATAVEDWKRKLTSAGVYNVILTGFISNDRLPLYQAAADILLMPYNRKFSGSGGGNIAEVSSPMKMFEYMAAGRVILTSDIPVLREILDENNAVFYSPEDFSDLKSKFSSLINNDSRRELLAQKALTDVREFDWKERMSKIMRSLKLPKKSLEI